MRKIMLFTLALLLFAPSAMAVKQKIKKANAETELFRYDIEYAKPGGDGMTLVKVWSYSKRSRVAAEQDRKNAVHGIIFKGYSSGSGNTSQRPLVKEPDAMEKHAEFFEAFFADDGSFRQFVSEITDGSQEIKKVGKQWKVGAVVTVSKDQLRKYLESQNIIRGLASGF